jgi:hypothetical protein
MFITNKNNINRKNPNNFVGLFCNARDESNIREWAAHHLLIGFDIIIIFDHKSIEPLKKVFSKFDKRVIIKEIKSNIPNIKNKLMNIATNIAKNMKLDWFIYLDADEFLILHNKFKGVKHFLNTYSYGDSIGVNWLMFGSNNLVEEPKGLIIENYNRSCEKLDQHVKSFVRPQQIINNSNPHFYNIFNKNRMIGLGFNILKYPQCFSDFNIPYANSPAYVAHYVFQSEHTYKKRKIDKIADDGSKRSDMGKDIHNHYNDVVNLQPQKYIKRIKDFLKFYS